jgi:hypothetical protein
VKDVKNKKELSLHEAFEKGLVLNVDRYATPFESISLWEAIDREQGPILRNSISAEKLLDKSYP